MTEHLLRVRHSAEHFSIWWVISLFLMVTLWDRELLIPTFHKKTLNLLEYMNLLQVSYIVSGSAGLQTHGGLLCSCFDCTSLWPRQVLKCRAKGVPCHPIPCFPSCQQTPRRVRFSEDCSLAVKSHRGSLVTEELQGLPLLLQPFHRGTYLPGHPQQNSPQPLGSEGPVQAASFSVFPLHIATCFWGPRHQPSLDPPLILFHAALLSEESLQTYVLK